MTRLVVAPQFARAARKFTRRNARLQLQIETTLTQLVANWQQPQLATHKLSGALHGAWACSCGYDCRIVFTVETDATGELVLVLANIGTHDTVY